MKRIAFRPYLLVLWAVVWVIASAAAINCFAVIFISVLGTPVILVLCFLTPARWKLNHWLLRNGVAVPLGLVLIASLAFTSWPLRAHYVLAKPALDRIAAEVRKGHKAKEPVQIGLWRILKAEDRRSYEGERIVCLWTNLDPSGYTGFVHTSPDKVDSQFNLWSSVALSRDWQFITED